MSVALIKIVGMFLNFSLFKILVLMSGPESIGVYSRFNSSVVLIGTLLSVGSENFMTKQSGKEKSGRNQKVLYTKYLFSTIIFAVSLIVFVLTIGWLSGVLNIERFSILLCSIFYALYLFNLGVIRGRHQSLKYAFYKFLGLSLLFLVAYFIFKTFHVSALITSYVIAIFGLTFGTLQFKSIRFTRELYNVQLILNSIREMAPYGLVLVGLSISQQTALILSVHFLDAMQQSALAMIVKFSNFALLPLVVINSINAGNYSKLYSMGQSHGLNALLKRVSIQNAFAALFIVMLLYLLRSYIFGFFELSGPYISVPYGIVLMGVLVSSLSGPTGMVIQMVCDDFKYAKIVFSAAILNISLLVLLGYYFGLIGFAVAISLSMIFLNLFTLRELKTYEIKTGVL